jgi:hypothetical protein
LRGDPAQKNRASGAEHGAKPEHGQPGAFGKVVNLASASSRTEDEFGDFVRSAEHIVGEFTWRFVWYRVWFHNVPPTMLFRVGRRRAGAILRKRIGVLALNLA